MSLLANELIRSLDQKPGDWKQGLFDHLVNERSGLEIDTGLMGFFFEVNLSEPHKSSFGLIDKWRVHRAIKRWRNRSLVMAKLARGDA